MNFVVKLAQNLLMFASLTDDNRGSNELLNSAPDGNTGTVNPRTFDMLSRAILAHHQLEGKNQSKQDAPQEQQTETEPTPSGETPKVEQETQPSTDEDMMRLCVPMIPSVGVLGVWLSTGGIAAYIEERIFLSCASSQKWTNIRAAPFLCALGGLTAF